MRFIKQLIFAIIIFCLFSLVFPRASYAYLDPGSGSYFLQIIIGVFLGAAFTIKLYWRRILAFFSNLFSRKNKQDGR